MASKSRSAFTSAALIALLFAGIVPASAVEFGAADAVATHAVAAPAAWAPLTSIYDGGLPPEPPARILAAAQVDGAAAVEPTPSKSASKKPLLYSLLLPGMGELSMGEKGRATGFFIAEGLIWSSYIYWTVAGNLRQDDYIEQANLNAGVGVGDGEDDYWRLVGQYERSSGTGPDSYEEELRREARDTYPDDPAAQDQYVAQNLPTGESAWEWTSSDLMATYQETRENSNRAFNRAEYSFAAAILNRIVSVIDVQLLRHKASKAQAMRDAPEYRLYADTDADGTGRLVIQRRF